MEFSIYCSVCALLVGYKMVQPLWKTVYYKTEHTLNIQPCNLASWYLSKKTKTCVHAKPDTWIFLRAQVCPALLWPHGLQPITPLSMGFSRQESWSGLPFPSTGDHPEPPALAHRFLTTEPLRSPRGYLQLLYSQTSKVGSSHDVIGLLCSVAQSCPTLWDPMDCSTPVFLVHHHLPEIAQTHVHRVSDAIQPSHPLLSPSPPALNLSQHQGLF